MSLETLGATNDWRCQFLILRRWVTAKQKVGRPSTMVSWNATKVATHKCLMRQKWNNSASGFWVESSTVFPKTHTALHGTDPTNAEAV